LADAQIDPLMFACAFCNHTSHTTGCKSCDCTEGLLTGIIPAMTLPLAPVGWLAFHALNHLPVRYADDEPDPDDEPRTCCANCCGACHGLVQLREVGLLDRLLAATGKAEDWCWWDKNAQTVRAGYMDVITAYCEGGDETDPSRCTDLTSPSDLSRCGTLGPRTCRENPEHPACRQERICSNPPVSNTEPDCIGPHSWEMSLS
jgi:hypothetical protein